MENRYKINYDIKLKNVVNVTFKQGDIDSSVLDVTLLDDGQPINITGGVIEFRFLKPDNTIVFQDASAGVNILDAVNGNVECVLKSNTIAAVGNVVCEIHIVQGEKTLTTQSFTFTVDQSISGEGILSENYISTIDGKLIEIQESEAIRVTNEAGRIALYNEISAKLANGELKGDKGDKGDTGEKGIPGEKGDTGLVPNITVGTVTTLAAGSTATVTRRENSPNEAPVFDLGIPQGANGADGNGTGDVTHTEFDPLVDKVNTHLSDYANYIEKSKSKDRLRNFIKSKKEIVISGDSIGLGEYAMNFPNDSWAGIIRKAMQQEYKTRNYGFVTLEDVSADGFVQYHSIVRQGFATEHFDASYYGSMYLTDTTLGNFINLAYIGKSFKVVYEGLTNGGTFDVKVDNVTIGTLDTSVIGTVPKASVSNLFTVSQWGTHTISLVKADNKVTNICGIIYLDDDTLPVVNNVSRGSLVAVDIANEIIDTYTTNGTCIVALGVNDQKDGYPLSAYEEKLNRYCTNIDNADGTIVLCDFIFNAPQSDPYKTVIRNVAKQHPRVIYIDFAKVFLGNATNNINAGLLNVDGVHPSEYGHEIIANVILHYLGLPYTKKTALGYNKWVVPTLSSGWVDFGGAFETSGYIKDGNTVRLKGIIKSGTIGNAIFNLPIGLRPSKNKFFPCICSDGITEVLGAINITADGWVTCKSGTNDWLSLDGISFLTD